MKKLQLLRYCGLLHLIEKINFREGILLIKKFSYIIHNQYFLYEEINKYLIDHKMSVKAQMSVATEKDLSYFNDYSVTN